MSVPTSSELPGPPPPDSPPRRPRRGPLVLAFVGILIAGCLGGAIGWGIVDTSCTETATVGDQLLSTVPDNEAPTRSCDASLIGGALVGAAAAAIGAGIVAGLMLRAQSEWRAHPPDLRSSGATSSGELSDGAREEFNRSESGGSPPRT